MKEEKLQKKTVESCLREADLDLEWALELCKDFDGAEDFKEKIEEVQKLLHVLILGLELQEES